MLNEKKSVPLVIHFIIYESPLKIGMRFKNSFLHPINTEL